MDTTNKWLLPVSVILAGIFIGGAILWNNAHPAPVATGTKTGTGAVAVNIKDVNTANAPFIGNASAPVTVAFWSDFQCPFCKQFEVNTLPQVVQNYVNSGKVKVVFFDFAFLGPNSTVDAEYARAVWQLYPSQYFAWRSAIFANQPQENSLSVAENMAWLAKTTGTISGIDFAKVKAAVAANQSSYDAAIAADRAQGQKFGINATPSFIIGTQMIPGAVPYAQFQSALDPLVK